jgi:hypothetical protein
VTQITTLVSSVSSGSPRTRWHGHTLLMVQYGFSNFVLWDRDWPPAGCIHRVLGDRNWKGDGRTICLELFQRLFVKLDWHGPFEGITSIRRMLYLSIVNVCWKSVMHMKALQSRQDNQEGHCHNENRNRNDSGMTEESRFSVLPKMVALFLALRAL